MDRVADEEPADDVDRVVAARRQDEQGLERDAAPRDGLHPAPAAARRQRDDEGVRDVAAEPEVVVGGVPERDDAVGEPPDDPVGRRQRRREEEEPVERVHRVQAERETRALPGEEHDAGDDEEEQLERQRPEPPHPLGGLLADEVAQRRNEVVAEIHDARGVPVAGRRQAAEGDGDRIERGERAHDPKPCARRPGRGALAGRVHDGAWEHRAYQMQVSMKS